jgi:hypothetical protein
MDPQHCLTYSVLFGHQVYLESIRKADGRDVGILLEVHIAVKSDDGNVVVQVAAVELWVDAHAEHVQLNVGVELAVVVHVPLAQADSQLLRPVTAKKPFIHCDYFW